MGTFQGIISCLYAEGLVVFFNEQDNLQIFLSQNKVIEAQQRQTSLSWHLATF